MLPYCLKCKKTLRVLTQKFLQLVMVEQWYYVSVLYATVKQEAKGLLSSLGIKTPLNKIPILGDVLFWVQLCWM